MYTNKNLKVIEGHLCHGCVQSLRKATCAKVATPLCMQLSTDTCVSFKIFKSKENVNTRPHWKTYTARH